jgi:hypothetical protein
MTFCTDIEKLIVKYPWKHKKPRTPKTILSKKSNAGGITIPNFKLYYRGITIKTARDRHKNRNKDQWTRIEDPDINSCIYSQLRQPPQQILLGKLDIHMYKTESRSMSFTLYKINSKWIKDLDIRPETLKQLLEVEGNTLEYIGIGNDFLNRTQKAQHLRETVNK